MVTKSKQFGCNYEDKLWMDLAHWLLLLKMLWMDLARF